MRKLPYLYYERSDISRGARVIKERQIEVNDITYEHGKDMVISSEVIRTGEVVFYARNVNESEENERIEIVHVERSMREALQELVRRTKEGTYGPEA